MSPHAVPIDAAELARRKDWLQFTAEDEARLGALRELSERHGEGIIADLDAHFIAKPQVAGFTASTENIDEVRAVTRAYFERAGAGDYGLAYATDRLTMGAEQQRLGLDTQWFLGAYAFWVAAVTRHLLEDGTDPRETLAIAGSLQKLMLLDIGLALDSYVGLRERAAGDEHRALGRQAREAQHAAILELSAPVLTVRPGLLILPIIGAIDSLRAQQITQNLLTAIRDRRARVAVIDITGVPAVDSAVANHLVQTVEACRLMGTSVLVTGLTPEVAQTLVLLGIDLGKMQTLGDLESGMIVAERIIASGGIGSQFE